MDSESGSSTALQLGLQGRFPRPPCARAARTSTKTWPGSRPQEARLTQGVQAPVPPALPAPPALQWLGTAPSGPRVWGSSRPQFLRARSQQGPGLMDPCTKTPEALSGPQGLGPGLQNPSAAQGKAQSLSRTTGAPSTDQTAHLPAAATMVLPADDGEGCFAGCAEATCLVRDPFRWIWDSGNEVSQRETCSSDGKLPFFSPPVPGPPLGLWSQETAGLTDDTCPPAPSDSLCCATGQATRTQDMGWEHPPGWPSP